MMNNVLAEEGVQGDAYDVLSTLERCSAIAPNAAVFIGLRGKGEVKASSLAVFLGGLRYRRDTKLQEPGRFIPTSFAYDQRVAALGGGGEMTMADVKGPFFALKQATGRDLPQGFKFGESLDELVAWAEGEEPEVEELEIEMEPAAPTGPAPHPLKNLMLKITDTGHEQSEMLAILNMVRDVVPITLAKADFMDDMMSSSPEVKKGKDYSIVSLQHVPFGKLSDMMSRLLRTQQGLAAIPTAVLLSLVAAFDTQMADIVRAMLGIKSDRLRAGQRTVPLSEIMAATSLQDLIDKAINDEVYQFSRGSHDDQVGYIEQSFSIKIKEKWKRWPDLIEIFERRNLVAHGERHFTKRYAEICTRAGHKKSDELVGTPVLITFKYLRQALGILTEFGILTAFSLWRKHVPADEPEAMSSLNEISFNLIESRRYDVAARIAEYALSLDNSKVTATTKLMFTVNLASAQKHMKQEEAFAKTLDKTDWTATSDDFQFCVAALREDFDELERILPIIKASERISATAIKEWPVFSFVRRNERFQIAYKAHFDDNLIEPVAFADLANEASLAEQAISHAEHAETKH